MTYVVAALYKFAPLDDYVEIKDPLLDVMNAHEICGTLLLAKEGINGTVAGCREGIDSLMKWLKQHPKLSEITWKESYEETQPFLFTRVKLKNEIVTMGIAGIDPNESVGEYVKPSDWNELISDPDVLLIDTRNEYEVGIGTFQGAINPNTESFREFPTYVNDNLDPSKHKKIAMFCTGGIRCEKASSYLKNHGYEDVYHLEGGILKYLEEVPESESLWEGECFVFDRRVSVDHRLEKGSYDQCHACRTPVSKEDMQSPDYVLGSRCPHCIDKYNESDRTRFMEREKQIHLDRKRGFEHRGSGANRRIEIDREDKYQKRDAQRAQEKG